MDNFAALGVLPAFIEKLAEKHITRPTAVQCMAIPPLLEGKSAIFRSATGTGKTFAYLIPALQRIINSPAEHGRSAGPALAICAPTLELCSQIKNEVEFLLGGGDIQRISGVLLLAG
jgi:superfamily II DNA/RNA helicase